MRSSSIGPLIELGINSHILDAIFIATPEFIATSTEELSSIEISIDSSPSLSLPSALAVTVISELKVPALIVTEDDDNS